MGEDVRHGGLLTDDKFHEHAVDQHIESRRIVGEVPASPSPNMLALRDTHVEHR